MGRAGLNLQLSYALERLNLALAYSPSYERSLEDANLSGTTHRLDFGLVSELTRRIRLEIRERLLSTSNLDLYAPASLPETTMVARRGKQLSQSLDVLLDHHVSRRVAWIAKVNQSVREYDDENASDSEERSARLGTAFDVTRGHRMELEAGLERYDYRDRGDAEVETLGVVWTYDLGRINRLRLDAGAFSADSTERRFVLRPGATGEREVVAEESEKGWRGGVQFAQDRQLIRWAAGVSRDISPGAGLGRPVAADNAFLGFSVPVGRRMELGLDGNGSRQNGLSSNRGLEDGQRNLTEFAAGTARAAWTFAPAFRLEGGYSQVWQRSQVESFGDLSYGRYFLNLAFRIYNSGEPPKEPASLGRPVDDQPDNQ